MTHPEPSPERRAHATRLYKRGLALLIAGVVLFVVGAALEVFVSPLAGALAIVAGLVVAWLGNRAFAQTARAVEPTRAGSF